MNILFAAPQSVSLVSGGVKRQMIETAMGLKELGHTVEYLSPDQFLPELGIDIVHFFGAQPEHYYALLHLKDYNIPSVLSPVFFSRRSGSMMRYLIYAQNLLSKTPLLSLSELQMRQKACDMATHLLPNTLSEADLVSTAFRQPKEKITIIPNGAETERFVSASPDLYLRRYPWRDFILYVGDLNAERKNVKKLIHAYSYLQKTDAEVPPLLLAGSLGFSSYATEIRALIEQNDSIHWTGPIDHQDPLLPSLYHAAKVFILPSYFETPGIAALEAALCGCDIVITSHGGTQEIFGDFATYVDPKSVSSIASGMKKALNQTSKRHSDALIKKIIAEYDWKQVAAKTADVYSSLIQ